MQDFQLLLRSHFERLQLLLKSISLEVLQPFTSQPVTDSSSLSRCHCRLVIEQCKDTYKIILVKYFYNL